MRIIVKFLINNFLSHTRFFKFKRFLLRLCGIKIGKNSSVVGPINFGNKCTISIGDGCWIGRNFIIDGNGYVEIGNNVDIAPEVLISTGGHKIGGFDRRAGKSLVNSVFVRNGCWLGTRVTIINNTVIGKGTVVGAGSLVTKSLNENSLYVGNPANLKRILSSDIL
jgi:maltose O-acetyltransferase